MGRRKSAWSGGEDTAHYSILVPSSLDAKLQKLAQDRYGGNVSEVVRQLLGSTLGEDGAVPETRESLEPIWLVLDVALRRAVNRLAEARGISVEACVADLLLEHVSTELEKQLGRRARLLSALAQDGDGEGQR